MSLVRKMRTIGKRSADGKGEALKEERGVCGQEEVWDGARKAKDGFQKK